VRVLFGEDWRVPNRRSISPIRHCHGNLSAHFVPKALGVIGRPTRRWYFYHAHVVESLLFGIKFRVDPEARQKWRTNRIRPSGIFDIYRATHGR
jgi:hypothetical protein